MKKVSFKAKVAGFLAVVLGFGLGGASLPIEGAVPTGRLGRAYDGVDFSVETGLLAPYTYVQFGSYMHVLSVVTRGGVGSPEVASRETTPTPIIWQVTGADAGGLTLTSRYVLDIGPLDAFRVENFAQSLTITERQHLRSFEALDEVNPAAIFRNGIPFVQAQEHVRGFRPVIQIDPAAIVYANDISIEGERIFQLILLANDGEGNNPLSLHSMTYNNFPLSHAATINRQPGEAVNFTTRVNDIDNTFIYHKMIGHHDSSRRIVSSGRTGASLTSTVISARVSLPTTGLSAGVYDAYIWLQRGNEASEPVALRVRVLGAAPSVILNWEEFEFVNASFDVDVVFDQQISSFTATSLAVVNGRVTDLVMTSAHDDEVSAFRATIQPTAAGEVSVAVPSEVVRNNLAQTNTNSNTITVEYNPDRPLARFGFEDGQILTSARPEELTVLFSHFMYSGDDGAYIFSTNDMVRTGLVQMTLNDEPFTDFSITYDGVGRTIRLHPIRLAFPEGQFSLQLVSGRIRSVAGYYLNGQTISFEIRFPSVSNFATSQSHFGPGGGSFELTVHGENLHYAESVRVFDGIHHYNIEIAEDGLTGSVILPVQANRTGEDITWQYIIYINEITTDRGPSITVSGS